MEFLTTARTAVRRAAQVSVRMASLGVAGALLGLGFSIGEKNEPDEADAEEGDRRAKAKVLISRVRVLESIRKMAPTVVAFAEGQEYEIRRELEAMGYYPCSFCGVPHLDGGKNPDCLPEGAYLHEELGKWIDPKHPDWSAEGYKAYWGEEFDENVDEAEDEPGPETVH